VIPVLICMCKIVVVSFQRDSSSPIPCTLPGSFLGISTSMLHHSRVGSSPVWNASLMMLTNIIHGSGLVSLCWYHVRRSSMRMPLGPRDLPVHMRCSAVTISSLLGASSGMSNLVKPHSGDPWGGDHQYNSWNSCPIRSISVALGGKMCGFFL